MTTATAQTAVSSPKRIVTTAGVGAWLSRPLASYHLVVTITILLSAFGLIMVLSASAPEAVAEGKDPYSMFWQQLGYMALGAVLFSLALRVSPRMLRSLAFPGIVLAVVALALVLVPGVGVKHLGARRWFEIAGVSVQPSEAAKLGLAIWGAHVLATRRRETAALRDYMVPLVPVATGMCVLIVLEPNLSTAVSVALIVAALLWYSGLSFKVFAAVAVVGTVSAALLAVSASYRAARVFTFFGKSADPSGSDYQPRQARLSLAAGGPFGEGLGQSRQKYQYVPNAHNDFIFAIIGEELGLIGCLLVLALFGALAYVGLRIAQRSLDPFLRLYSASATTLLIGQMLINVGYVTGLLPVTGVQLPLVSAGGSSTAVTLLMLGILANAARHEPDAISALRAARPGRVSRFLRLPLPEPVRPYQAKLLRGQGSRARVPSPERGRGAQERPTGSAKARPVQAANPSRRARTRRWDSPPMGEAERPRQPRRPMAQRPPEGRRPAPPLRRPRSSGR
ncbi:putative lipid II flippase FtsW [Segniliparus rugosus]|uniref:Probable peptidoglycan glycosyltransferase FtsW n=1 Tax=Segniliparus rugosus (strain ATCC BAA-974 / DSM 45345 / CCUG 50838 / CIP 108380 / JCM 13579 / CDC 945) TaxID=679197 RepID=E5XTP3_SEGRC|nr:putative lipid II flippase FtsW [Segniliparus rugosus]EFV12283.1 cell division protein FtsW [Segniliparus rugosus ATCC BAA-974]